MFAIRFFFECRIDVPYSDLGHDQNIGLVKARYSHPLCIKTTCTKFSQFSFGRQTYIWECVEFVQRNLLKKVKFAWSKSGLNGLFVDKYSKGLK
jgi:hypothetical protein